jgi:hypothetical protein
MILRQPYDIPHMALHSKFFSSKEFQAARSRSIIQAFANSKACKSRPAIHVTMQSACTKLKLRISKHQKQVEVQTTSAST